jgi:hypothetical protein
MCVTVIAVSSQKLLNVALAKHVVPGLLCEFRSQSVSGSGTQLGVETLELAS